MILDERQRSVGLVLLFVFVIDCDSDWTDVF